MSAAPDNDIQPAEPDTVAICGDCERRADDLAVRSCTDPHCPLRARRAA